MVERGIDKAPDSIGKNYFEYENGHILKHGI